VTTDANLDRSTPRNQRRGPKHDADGGSCYHARICWLPFRPHLHPKWQRRLHVFFLDSKPESPDINGITKLAISSERFQLIDSVFYLHAPDGFGRSKLAAGAERKLGVPLTARNYTTIHNLSEMLGAD
jgi:uncharacterized protein (DUF1697 family)